HLVASMILDCCANERAYQRDIGLIGERLCKLLPSYVDAFDDLFGRQYTVIHRYETTKLRNMAKFFGHLIVSEALPWDILEYIKLTETETTSSSRIFIKVIFQEFAYWMGVKALKSKIEEEELKEALSGIFPKDSPKETRFAINFFTTIGLGALTAQMREHLEDLQKKIKERRMKETDSDSSDSDSSSSGSDSDSSESSSGDDNTSSGEETSNSGDQESSSE
ncbi:pre-mRNA-splicing factor cwc22, partial [Bonamia ostreae]